MYTKRNKKTRSYTNQIVRQQVNNVQQQVNNVQQQQPIHASSPFKPTIDAQSVISSTITSTRKQLNFPANTDPLLDEIKNKNPRIHYLLSDDERVYEEVIFIGPYPQDQNKIVIQDEVNQIRPVIAKQLYNKQNFISLINNMLNSGRQQAMPRKKGILEEQPQNVNDDQQQQIIIPPENQQPINEPANVITVDPPDEKREIVPEPDNEEQSESSDDDLFKDGELWQITEVLETDIPQKLEVTINIEAAINDENKLKLLQSQDGHRRKVTVLAEFATNERAVIENHGDWLAVYKHKSKKQWIVQKDKIEDYDKSKLDTRWDQRRAELFEKKIEQRAKEKMIKIKEKFRRKLEEQTLIKNRKNGENDQLNKILMNIAEANEKTIAESRKQTQAMLLLAGENDRDKKPAKMNQMNRWDKNVIYTGDNNRYGGIKGTSLREVLIRWNIHVEAHGIRRENWVNWWTHSILKGKAYNIYKINYKVINDSHDPFAKLLKN